MKILSIYLGHNASVGVFENGKCITIIQEEKLSNKKNHMGWPHRSINYVDQTHKLQNFDYITITSKQQGHIVDDRIKETNSAVSNNLLKLVPGRILEVYVWLWYKMGNIWIFDYIFRFMEEKFFTIAGHKEIEEKLQKEWEIPAEKVVYIDHHESHALTPIFFYGLENRSDDFLVITMDGLGDDVFSRVYEYRAQDKTLKQIAESPYNTSLGLMYAELTSYLGMKPIEHEYKVMGLAAYVTSKEYFDNIYNKLSKIIWLNEESLTFESTVSMFSSIKLWMRDNFVGERFDNISAAVQRLLEDLVCKYVLASIKKTGIKRVVLSGGVFMNVKLNKKIMELPEVEELILQPSGGDESTVIGNAAKIFIENKIKLNPIETMYSSLKYSNAEVKDFLNTTNALKNYKVDYFENSEELFMEIVELLAKFEIVGVFRGAGEWGARSLCNRTILANASDLKSFYQVNDAIKMRDFWMPFAPTLLLEWADKYIKDWKNLEPKIKKSSKYMIQAFDSTELGQNHLRAAIHQKDKSLRPQILEEKDNPDIYRIFKKYEQKTGMGGMMNTSLNMHGYPLVGSLKQALFTFEKSGLKYIALENYLISKI